MGWQGDPEDVVQDVFFAAFRQISRFRGDSELNTWLTRITLNICRSRQRRSTRWLGWFRRQSSREHAESSQPAETDETALLVRRAVQSLGQADREVVVLYYLETRTGKEIAELLAISPGAVDVRLHRARNRLKVLLKNLEPDFTHAG